MAPLVKDGAHIRKISKVQYEVSENEKVETYATQETELTHRDSIRTRTNNIDRTG